MRGNGLVIGLHVLRTILLLISRLFLCCRMLGIRTGICVTLAEVSRLGGISLRALFSSSQGCHLSRVTNFLNAKSQRESYKDNPMIWDLLV